MCGTDLIMQTWQEAGGWPPHEQISVARIERELVTFLNLFAAADASLAPKDGSQPS